MDNSTIRQEARSRLSGKWLKAALLLLIYIVIEIGLSIVLNLIPLIGSLILIVINVPLSFGLVVAFIKLIRDEDFSYTSFFNDGFNNFAKVWGVVLNTMLKLLPYILTFIGLFILYIIATAITVASSVGSSNNITTLFNSSIAITIIFFILYIVACILFTVKSYLYSLSYYILYDNPDMTGKEIVEKSAELMYGNRAKLFWLQLSFIGWAILCTFTLGIGYFFLIPYMQFAIIIFYENLAGTTSDYKIEDNDKEDKEDDFDYEINSNTNVEEDSKIDDENNNNEETTEE